MTSQSSHSIRRIAGLALALTLLLPAAALADHAFLGITSHSVSGDDARRLDLPSRDGAIIEKVYRNTAAEAAGLQRRDIIVEFGGDKVYDDSDLTDLIRSRDPGESVAIGILRDGKPMTLNATLGSYRDHEDSDEEGSWVSAIGSFFGGDSERPTLGVHVMDLNAQLAEYFGVKDTRGVLITQVVRRSPAQEAGIQAGDVITRVAGSRIFGTGDIGDALEGRWGETVTVELVRRGKSMDVQVQIEDE